MIEIHGRKVGIGEPAYIVAEIGINHNGDTALAIQMITAAKEAGCDAVKFQNYKTESFIAQRSEHWEYRVRGEVRRERQFDMFKRCELDRAKLGWLKAHCDRIGIHMHSTPMCLEGLRDCVDRGFGVIKNGSDCLQDLELIKAMAMTGLPVVISTGMATKEEIDRAFDAYISDNSIQTGGLIMLHCTSAYPCPDEDANISRVRTLRFKYQCLGGLSDHTEGTTAAVLAIAHGACWIEKHFTLDKAMHGPDHEFSADPQEMAELVRAVRKAEKQMGNPALGMTELEKNNRKAWFK